MATGVFDILHAGHLAFLEEARKLGDELVVVVATDRIAERMKHRPIQSQRIRLRLIAALRIVDRAVMGDEHDIYKTVERQRPDVIALGYDQRFDEGKLEEEIGARGLGPVNIVRLKKAGGELEATRRLVQRVLEWNAVRTRLDELEDGMVIRKRPVKRTRPSRNGRKAGR
jgi:FAD synthetase